MKDIRRHKFSLSKEDIRNLTDFIYEETNGVFASTFFNLPLPLKRHSVQVSAVAEQMAKYVPESEIPAGMARDNYINAVRYGCLYHDIGAFVVYNHRQFYPEAGGRLLREYLSEEVSDPLARKVILETVQAYGERYDGQGYPDHLTGDKIPFHAGICAIADQTDGIIYGRSGLFVNPAADAKQFVLENTGQAFVPDAVRCFTEAYADIVHLYKHWRKKPPFWKNTDIKPLDRPVEKPIG